MVISFSKDLVLNFLACVGKSHGVNSSCYFLHVIFFVTRGAPTDVKEDVRARVDTIHAMLGLAKDQALIRQEHPLLGEYQAPSAGHALRFFPTESKGALTIVQPMPGSWSLQVL